RRRRPVKYVRLVETSSQMASMPAASISAWARSMRWARSATPIAGASPRIERRAASSASAVDPPTPIVITLLLQWPGAFSLLLVRRPRARRERATKKKLGVFGRAAPLQRRSWPLGPELIGRQNMSAAGAARPDRRPLVSSLRVGLAGGKLQ